MNGTHDKVIVTSGSRLRRLTPDGRTLMDQGLIEGMVIDRDIVARVLGVVQDVARTKSALVVELETPDGTLVRGWVYSYETAPA